VAGQLTMLKTLLLQCGDLYGNIPLTVYFFEEEYRTLYENAVLMPSISVENKDAVTPDISLKIVPSVENMRFYAFRNQKPTKKRQVPKDVVLVQTQAFNEMDTKTRAGGQMHDLYRRCQDTLIDLETSSDDEGVVAVKSMVVIDFSMQSSEDDSSRLVDDSGCDEKGEEDDDSDDTSWLTTSMKELSVGTKLNTMQGCPTYSIDNNTDSDSFEIPSSMVSRSKQLVGNMPMPSTATTNKIVYIETSSDEYDVAPSQVSSTFKRQALPASKCVGPKGTRRSAVSETSTRRFQSKTRSSVMELESDDDDDDDNYLTDLDVPLKRRVFKSKCTNKGTTSAAEMIRKTGDTIELIDLCSP
jgi:hypothetical protein